MTDPSADLRFSDRRRDGAYDVTGPHGVVVARIRAGWTGHRFTVTDPQGTVLCTARTSWWRLPARWDVTDPDGGPLLVARMRGITRTAAEVHLERGGRLVVQGSAWRRDFRVVDEHGRVVLTAVPRTSAFSLRRHDYAVQLDRRILQLAEAVALVHLWRTTMKEESATAASGALAGGAAAG